MSAKTIVKYPYLLGLYQTKSTPWLLKRLETLHLIEGVELQKIARRAVRQVLLWRQVRNNQGWPTGRSRDYKYAKKKILLRLKKATAPIPARELLEHVLLCGCNDKIFRKAILDLVDMHRIKVTPDLCYHIA